MDFWTQPEVTESAIIVETSPIHLPNINTTDFYLDRVQYIRLQPFQSVAEAKIEAYLQMIDLGIKVISSVSPFVRSVASQSTLIAWSCWTFRQRRGSTCRSCRRTRYWTGLWKLLSRRRVLFLLLGRVWIKCCSTLPQ